jgi:hypothetical protein
LITYCRDNIFDPVLILSGDKDFVQLHKHPNVKQFDPTRKKFVDCKTAALSQGYTEWAGQSPENFLSEMILRGDSGDGVPNVLSPDNCLVIGQRQKAMTKKRVEELRSKDPSEYDPEISRRYDMNKTMVDLDLTPIDIKDRIVLEYQAQIVKPKHDLLNYFVKKRLKNLLSSIGDF